ncbi:MAG: NAD-dependent epimerase/dehydratase family protein [Deltaproteobacteria bacterium]|nr:NAD-dependent epimerase/dehydratase family protein [Deltaproteobacteria bacterium]MBW2417839.1 NAD-dependent epimerase/dehydratase family protein [Deltaproteobacteria bacterium]
MRALVTGGGGFLGEAIVSRLLVRGAEVRSLARGRYPELEDRGVETFQGDVADPDAVAHTAAGCDVVFHVAARVGAWGPRAAFRGTNVTGTENVLAACRSHGVPKLVYTSTPSVVHAGRDIEGADESLPYASHFETAYSETKAEAERRVLAANGDGLATVALRPHLVWGPGDNHLIPRLLTRARAGRVRLIGRRDKLVDATYIDNAAEAHLQAADRLGPEAACAGRAYFIAQGEPLPASELINAILAAAGLPPEHRRIPLPVAWCAGAVAEAVFWLLRREDEPPLTRFVARQLATAHWYDLGAARRDLGYAPAVSMREGLARLREHFEKQAAASASAGEGALA